MFRKLISFLMLGLILFQLIGFSVYFSIEKAKIQKQLKTYIKEGVPDDQFKVFVFSASQLKSLTWIKKNEFKIGERFFDIVRKKTLRKGWCQLQCVDDQQETRLFTHLAQFVNSNLSDRHSNNPLNSVFDQLQQPYLVIDKEYPVKPVNYERKARIIHFCTKKLAQPFLEILKPPPIA